MEEIMAGDEVLFTFVEDVSSLTSKIYDGEIAKVLVVMDGDRTPYTIKFSDGVVDCVTADEVKDPSEDDPSALGSRFF